MSRPLESSRLNVAIVAPSTRILGGQAVQAERLLRAWEGDPDVRVWLVPVDPLPPAPLRRARSIKYLRTLITQLTYWPLLLRELRHADVVHVFSASYLSFLLAPLPAVLIARLYGKPIVMNYRSGEAPDHLKRSALARAVLRSVDRNAVPSRFLHDVFAGFGIDSEIVPNIVDLNRFRYRSRTPLAPRIVSTRNFESLYNVACTIRAFALIQREYPDATLTLIGKGSQESELRALVEALGVQNVAFKGPIPPADIWRHYADADIYLQTPEIDNMPASVLEAYASGCAVVSTDVGGVPAILADGIQGLLARRDDHEAIAAAVIRLLRDPALAEQLTKHARQACDAYQWSHVRARWLTLYRQLASPDAVPAANPA